MYAMWMCCAMPQRRANVIIHIVLYPRHRKRTRETVSTDELGREVHVIETAYSNGSR